MQFGSFHFSFTKFFNHFSEKYPHYPYGILNEQTGIVAFIAMTIERLFMEPNRSKLLSNVNRNRH